MKNLVKTKWFTYGTYILLVIVVVFLGMILFKNNNTFKNVFVSFFNVAENRTFDYRQWIKVNHKHPLPNDDIVILTVDDASLEYLWDKYGEWPLPRDIYANLINYIEKQNPQAIIFDMMFIKSVRTSPHIDKYLTDTMNKYENVYVGMNFDHQPSDVRKPEDIPDRIQYILDNQSNIDFKKATYENCRLILSSLLNGDVNIGMTNVARDNDGIIRTVMPLLVYKDKFYPYLSLRAGLDCLRQERDNKITIDKNGKINVAGTTIPLNKDGETFLNWYGEAGTHTQIPLYKVINEMDSTDKSKLGKTYDFKDKIILVGTTAMSLHDTKSVPIEENTYPGVEIHATFLNNILDNNFIQKTGDIANTLIAIAVIAIVGGIVMFSSSTLFAFLSTSLFGIAYLFVSYYVMELYNLWIPVIFPILAIIFAFTLSILAKYLMKSRDFEYQYKLATIDGLTELYNHRYFQDTLRKQMDIARRYNQPVSLIIADIDFFKKFNDTYGHQTGDAVLRQVAQTLTKNSRATDSVCRYGGEEMSIIMPNTSATEALNLAERICKAVAEKPFHITPVETAQVTISLGLATFPENAQTPQDLIEYADKGLYYAKEHGRNQVGRY